MGKIIHNTNVLRAIILSVCSLLLYLYAYSYTLAITMSKFATCFKKKKLLILITLSSCERRWKGRWSGRSQRVSWGGRGGMRGKGGEGERTANGLKAGVGV